MASSSSRTNKIMYRMSGCLRLQIKMMKNDQSLPFTLPYISILFALYIDNPQQLLHARMHAHTHTLTHTHTHTHTHTDEYSIV